MINEDILKYLRHLQIAFIRAVFSLLCIVIVWGLWLLLLYARTSLRIGLEGMNGSEIYVLCGITAVLVITISVSSKQYRSWKSNELFCVVKDIIHGQIVTKQGDDFNIDSQLETICKTPFTIAKYLKVKEPLINVHRVLAILVGVLAVLITMIPGCIKGVNVRNIQYSKICSTEKEFMNVFDTTQYCWDHLQREDFIVNTEHVYEINKFVEDKTVPVATVLITVIPDGTITDVVYSIPIGNGEEALQEAINTALTVHGDVISAESRDLPVNGVELPTKEDLELTSKEFLREGVELTEVTNNNFSMIITSMNDESSGITENYLFVLFK